jgi:hypothetical protein
MLISTLRLFLPERQGIESWELSNEAPILDWMGDEFTARQLQLKAQPVIIVLVIIASLDQLAEW